MKFVDIHTHKSCVFPDECIVRNLYFEIAEEPLFALGEGLFSLGVHPWNADKTETGWHDKLKTLCNNKCVALIGECGLDKNASSPLLQQVEVFKKHIILSEELCKPLIIHCVGRFNELLAIRKQQNSTQKWIIHGFRGKPQLAEQILDAGCDISFGEKFNAESVRRVPLERLFVETDESEMPVNDIYQAIARIKGCNPEHISAGNRLLNC